MTRRTRILSLALGLAATAAIAAPAAAQQNPTVRPQDRSPCRDPWINIAVRELKGRAPNGSHESGECNIHLYNGARWNSYAELKGYVGSVLRTLDGYDARFGPDGNFYFDDDYNNHVVPLGNVRVLSSRGVTDGNGNGARDDGSQFSGAIGLPNGVTLRFARGR